MNRDGPTFQTVLYMVFAISVLSGIGTVLLALVGGDGNQSIQSAQSLLANAFSGSVGALLALIGGRRLS